MTSEIPSTPEQVPPRLLESGVTGAGGAGFPSHVKWRALDSVDCLIVNLQEGEPVFYGDRWLVNERPEVYRKGFEYLLENFFSTVVIATKEKYRKDWIADLETEFDPEVLDPDDLPVKFEQKQGLFLAYTGERYELSQETSLLWTVAGLQIGEDLPTEHGWIVHNAETVYNIFRALFEDEAVTRKLLAVYGPQFSHRFFELPVGTPFRELMNFCEPEKLSEVSDLVVMDGGPGWASEVESPLEFGVSKRTNGLMVAGRDFMEEYRDPREPERINCMAAHDWVDADHEQEPRCHEPDEVYLPLLSNPGLEGIVQPARPVVEPGQEVEAGQPVARPAETGISNYHHASIDGTVKKVTDSRIVIKR